MHKENLIKEIPKEPTAMGLFSSNGWIGWIDNFSHRRKLLEHLYTGHRELFNSLDSVMTLKDENKEYERIYNLLRNRIREEARIIGFANNPKPTEPSFDIDGVTLHTINSMGENRNVNFVPHHGQNTHVSMIIDDNDEVRGRFNIPYSNQTRLADDLAISLNRIAAEDNVIDTVRNYIELRNKNIESRNTFNQKFSILLNNIRLDPNNLKGACEDHDDSGCLQYYDENDSKEYRAKLVEMDNINWINKSS
jgi:hypothetical protein